MVSTRNSYHTTNIVVERNPLSKGESLVIALNSNCHIFIFKIDKGFSISKRTISTVSIPVFSEARNFATFKRGFLCLISDEKLTNLPMGIVDSSPKIFLAVIIGYYYDTDLKEIRMVVRKKRSCTLDLEDYTSNCTSKFMSKDSHLLFENELSFLSPFDVAVYFLNQIAGPTLNGYRKGSSVNYEQYSRTIASKYTPDIVYVPRTIDLKKLPYPLVTSRLPIKRWGGTKSVHIPIQYKKTTIFYSFLKNSKIQDKMKQDKYYLIEYPTSPTSEEVILAPLTAIQLAQLKKHFQDRKRSSWMGIEFFCKKLDMFLRKSGMDLVKLKKIELDHDVSNVIVAVCESEEKSRIIESAKKISDDLFQVTIDGNCKDHLVENGAVVFRAYIWPFRNSLEESDIPFLQCFSSGKGLKRSCTNHDGRFESIGRRQTNQASASLVSTSGNTVEHDYLRLNGSMNIALLPIARKIMNRLGEESLFCQYACGEVFMSVLKNALGTRDNDEICPHLLFTTDGFYNSVHSDCDKMNQKSTELVEKEMAKNAEFLDYNLRWKRIMKSDLLPLGTTCCWLFDKKSNTTGTKLGCASGSNFNLASDSDMNFEHRQFFTVVDCHVALSLCEGVMDCVEQIGASFYGAFIFHNTTVPIWIDWDKGLVSLDKNGKSWNTAWGKSGQSKEYRARKRREREMNL